METGTTTSITGMALRTMVDPNDPQDVKQARALQDAVVVKQKSPGRFEIPNWDQVTQKNVRDMLLGLNATLPDLKRAFGSRTQVDHGRSSQDPAPARLR